MLNQTRLLPTLAIAAMGLLVPTQAMALTFNWSFVTDEFSTGGAGQTISGTISGLVEGSNDGTGVTVTVDSTPTGELLGGGWIFETSTAGDAFTVTGGSVTFADALFTRNSGFELLLFGGFGGFFPQLLDNNNGVPTWSNFDGGATTFTPAEVATTPEPGTVLALMGLGLGVLVSRGKKQA